jgi:hypothetical protein
MRLISLKVAGVIALSLCAASFACGSDVHDADKFALGGIGVAGTMSKGESALRTILDQPDAVTQLEKMLPHATDAGRLYILVGLHLRDRSAYKRAFDSYSQHDSTVETVRGCMVSRNHSKRSCATLIAAILMVCLSNLHGDSNVVLHCAKRARLIALALLLSGPFTLCRGEAATEHQSNEYDRILQLISNEDWKAASDAAASYLAKVGTSGDEGLQARLRYIIIYTTAGAVSTGASEFDVLDQRLKSFVGKSVTLLHRPLSMVHVQAG